MKLRALILRAERQIAYFRCFPSPGGGEAAMMAALAVGTYDYETGIGLLKRTCGPITRGSPRQIENAARILIQRATVH